MFSNLRKKRDIHRILDEQNRKLSDTFKDIREEFEEHLISINENTNEIQGNYESLSEIDARLEKMAERIDQLSLLVGLSSKNDSSRLITLPLNGTEQELFMRLYTMSDSGAVPLEMLARKSGLTVELAVSQLNNMVKKGIPLQKRRIEGDVHLSLEPGFKQLQAKENVVGISEEVASRLNALMH